MGSLVFLDVETTGLKDTDRIIEIYMLRVDEDGNPEEFHSLVNPGMPIPPFVTRLTGITSADVADAPNEQSIAPQIRQFIGDGILVAHNLSFDRRFLEGMMIRTGQKPLGSGGFDTLEMSRQLFPKLCVYPNGGGSHKLVNLMYHFGLDKYFANSHRAKDDVLLLVQVFRELQLYQAGETAYTYPTEVTHGCPTCGAAMYVVPTEQGYVLECRKDCGNEKLVV